MHHGIKGMKWGVRRFQKKDGSLTSAGKKRYSEDSDSKKDDENKSEEGPQKEKKQLTRKQKAAIAGAAIVAAYATYKFVDSGKANRLIAKGKAALGHTEPDFNKNILLANKRLDSDGIMKTVVSRINPGYGGIGTKNNCRRCTFAYEMSRRGYDVKATKSINGTGQSGFNFIKATSKNVSGFWDAAKEAAFNSDSVASKMFNEGGGLGTKKIPKIDSDSGFAKSIFDSLSGYNNGARGELSVKWSSGGGHSMAWEIVKGKPVIFDCQDGTKYDTPEMFKDLGDLISEASTTRLDNLDLNKDFLLRWLQNA